MGRKILSDALIAQTKHDVRFELFADRNYDSAANSAVSIQAEVVLVEVPETGSEDRAERCLMICDQVRQLVPGSKQVLLCSESDTLACRAAISAKQENRIDDFLFYDTSITYLFSKLEALMQ